MTLYRMQETLMIGDNRRVKHWIAAALVLLPFLLFTNTARGQDKGGRVPTRVDGVDILEFGIYKTEVSRMVPSPDSRTGQVSAMSRRKTELLSETDQIPARLHSLFGFRYKVRGEPRYRMIPINLVVLFPSEPKERQTAKLPDRITHTLTPPIGKKDFVGFGFQTEDERIPGIWTFQLYYQKELLAEKKFNVFLADSSPSDR